jgi:hypothetical protein
MGAVRRLVLDTLKPHAPSIVELSMRLSDLPGVEAVNISIYEMDLHVENAKITIEGPSIDYEKVVEQLREFGATVHSIDEVVAGRSIIDDASTPQDPHQG